MRVLSLVSLILASISASASSPTRALRIGPSASILLSSKSLGTTPVAPGVWAAYEFLIRPKFHLGIHAAFRSHSTEPALSQLGYGLLLKHAFREPEAAFIPYAEYGLLLSMNFLSGRPGNGVAHDTRLATGAEFLLGDERFFADLGYHYSRLGFFGIDKINLDTLELAFGWRKRW